ncbi:MAG: cytochrome B [Rubrivivax sp.]|nr:MAG: cytochrome B [Rubrivivax sp.]
MKLQQTLERRQHVLDEARLAQRPVAKPDASPPVIEPIHQALPTDPVRVRLWDLPTRIFHWSLVAAVTTAIVTAKVGGSWMSLHGQAGLAIVGLVSFRVVWGFIGPAHARFASFWPTPGKLKAYLQGRWQGLGHNPLGAFSVFALLGLLIAQSTSGLFSNDDIDFAGPLAGLVDEGLSGQLTQWHQLLSDGLLILLGLHVAAIMFYLWFKKDNLVRPMVTGWKDVEPGEPAAIPAVGKPGVRRLPVRVRPIALIAALLVAAVAVVLASGVWWPAPAAVALPVAPADQANSTAPAW